MSEKGINQRMWHRVGRSGKVLTLLGGGFVDFTHLKQCLEVYPILIAADGGADSALSIGKVPQKVIGDLDSLSVEARARLPPEALIHIQEQDSTDFEKCLQHIDADLILAFGFTGGRLDHELAVLNALAKHPQQKCILIGQEDICFLAPLKLDLDLKPDTRFSLFPMAHATGRSEGLVYPIDGLQMAPDQQIGTSNRVSGPVRLSFDQRKMLLILPLEVLGAVCEALISCDEITNN